MLPGKAAPLEHAVLNFPVLLVDVEVIPANIKVLISRVLPPFIANAPVTVNVLFAVPDKVTVLFPPIVKLLKDCAGTRLIVIADEGLIIKLSVKDTVFLEGLH